MTSPSAVSALVLDAINLWDGTVAGATWIRSQMQKVLAGRGVEFKSAPLESPAPDAARLAALVRVADTYRRRMPRHLLINPSIDLVTATVFGPFIGDEEIGPWPWDNPANVGDEEALLWLPLIAACAPVDDPKIGQLVQILFKARRRQIWIAASRAFAQLASRSPAWALRATEHWRQAFPAGLPPRWARSGLGGPEKSQATISAHDRRHALHLICACVGATAMKSADFQGFDPGQLTTLTLPTDRSDASVLLQAFGELVLTPACRPDVRHAVAGAADTIESGHALRELYDSLRRRDPDSGSLLERLDHRLIAVSWVGGMTSDERFDRLCQWLATARWYGETGRTDVLARMRTAAPEAADLLQLCTESSLPASMRDEVSAILARLPIVFDPLVAQTELPVIVSLRTAELLLLVQRPAVRDVPWAALLRRVAVVPAESSSARDTVGDVSRAEIAVALAERGIASETLLQESSFNLAELCRLSRSRNGRVAIQVAVQLEQWLRSPNLPRAMHAFVPASGGVPPHGEAQLRLLWRVLQADPPDKVFIELAKMLRADGAPLHRFVTAVVAFDRARATGEVSGAEGPPNATALTSIVDVIRSAAELMGGRVQPATVNLFESMVPSVEAVMRTLGVARLSPDDAEWWVSVERFLFGAESAPLGVVGLGQWLGAPIVGLPADWIGLKQAHDEVWQGDGVPLPGQCERARQALAAVRHACRSLATPEHYVVAAVLAQIEEVLARAEASAEKSARLAASVRAVMSRNGEQDERRLVALVASDDLKSLPAEDVRRLSVYLLDHQRFLAAMRLRRATLHRVHAERVWTYLFPVLVGVVAGPLMVLDVGIQTDRLISTPPLYWLTVVGGLSWSALLLGSHLVQSLGTRQGISWPRRLRHVTRRTLMVLLPALAIALGASATVLATIAWDGKQPHPVALLRSECVPLYTARCTAVLSSLGATTLLWASLSLFLGLFLGLLLQGRSFTSRG